MNFQLLVYDVFFQGMKGNALETQYPMLCEGTRRQRGDLVQALLFHNKDDNGRIREIMDVLLDKDRYDLPNATRERQNKKKEEKNDCQDNKSQSSETSNDDTVSTRSNIGLPTREGKYVDLLPYYLYSKHLFLTQIRALSL